MSVESEQPPVLNQEVFLDPQPNEKTPQVPGAGAILLAAVGFIFAQFFLLAAGMLVVQLFPHIPMQWVNMGILLVSTLFWGGGAWLWIQSRQMPSDWLSLAFPQVRGWFWPTLIVMVPTAILFGGSIDMLMESLFAIQPRPDPTLEDLSDMAMGSVGLQWLVVFLAVIAAPVSEELFFRGVALRSLRFRKWSFLAASGFTSLLFASIHFKITGFFLLFTLAMVLAMLAERTRSLLPSIVFHAAHNAFVLGITMWHLAKKPVMQSFSMVAPAASKTPTLPEASTMLVHFLYTFPWFFGLFALLYFGAVPQLQPETKESL